MNEIDKTNLSGQTKIRSDERGEIEIYLKSEINQRKVCSKKLSKYATIFDYIDKVLNVLSATSGGVCIISFVSVVGAAVGTAGASFTVILSLPTGIIKKLLSITRNKKKKHDKVLMLAKSKLNNIEALVSQALIDMEISHQEFVTILEEKEKYEKIKENVRTVSEKLEEKQENRRVDSVNSKKRDL